jgi:hypothetical protein
LVIKKALNEFDNIVGWATIKKIFHTALFIQFIFQFTFYSLSTFIALAGNTSLNLVQNPDHININNYKNLARNNQTGTINA